MCRCHSSNATQNYTQNIDTLEVRAGVHKVLQCHGSFATASCINCHQHVPGIAIEADILNQRVPLCKICNATPPAILSAEKAKKKPKPKKRSSAPWESDGEEEPDVPAYPPGIMKVSTMELFSRANLMAYAL